MYGRVTVFGIPQVRQSSKVPDHGGTDSVRKIKCLGSARAIYLPCLCSASSELGSAQPLRIADCVPRDLKCSISASASTFVVKQIVHACVVCVVDPGYGRYAGVRQCDLKVEAANASLSHRAGSATITHAYAIASVCSTLITMHPCTAQLIVLYMLCPLLSSSWP